MDSLSAKDKDGSARMRQPEAQEALATPQSLLRPAVCIDDDRRSAKDKDGSATKWHHVVPTVKHVVRQASAMYGPATMRRYWALKEQDDSARWTHDVYISFRYEEDTGRGFTSHLFEALLRNGIDCFSNDNGSHEGEAISPSVLTALEVSRMAIVVLSSNYARSSWCLDELVHILTCKQERQQTVLPVFYDVDPSHVRHQKGSFAEALARHEKRLGLERVRRWRRVLEEITNLPGCVSINDNDEAKLIQRIVGRVLRELDSTLSSAPPDKDLVGIGDRLAEIESYFYTESDKVCTIGIWGMPGLGKTTIAQQVFKRFSPQFVSSAFVADIRETCSKHGLVYLQKKLSEILLDSKLEKQMFHRNSFQLLHQRFKMLIVLDDVDSLDQIEALVVKSRKKKKLPGSRIIITTRNEKLLTSYGVDDIYEVRSLNEDEALRLLYQQAFKETNPKDDYKELSLQIVRLANGHPSVLKSVGSYLCGKSVEEWMRVVNRMKEMPDLLLRESISGYIDCLTSSQLLDISQNLSMNSAQKISQSPHRPREQIDWSEDTRVQSLPLLALHEEHLSPSGCSDIDEQDDSVGQGSGVALIAKNEQYSKGHGDEDADEHTLEQQGFLSSKSIKDSTSFLPLPMPLESTSDLLPTFLQELIKDREAFQIVFLCTGIPDWCTSQSSTSPVSLKLPPEDNDHYWMNGIIICFVFVKKTLGNFDEGWKQKATLGHFLVNVNHIVNTINFENFEHLEPGSFGVCCYIPQEWFAETLSKESSMIEASVRTERPDLELTSYGMHLISEQDVEECSQNLAQTATEHDQHVDLNFSQHCTLLLNGRMKLENVGDMISSANYPVEEVNASKKQPGEAKKKHSDTITQMEGDIRLLLSRLFQGRYVQKNRFYFIIPHRFFSNWFFHHSLGDIAICYLPPGVFSDEKWVGLELYVLFKRRPAVLRSNLDSDQTTSLLLTDLYAHGTSTLPILTYPLLINDPFYGSHFALYHVPRECFPEELSQCRGISTLFRPSDRDLEVEMCGARLLYEQDSESLIEVMIDSTRGREDALQLLHDQVQMYLKAETSERDEVEQEVPHCGLFSSFESEKIDALQKLLTSTEQDAEEVHPLLQKYRYCTTHRRDYQEFDPILLHYKQELSSNQEHIHETSRINHLYIMAECLEFQNSDLVYWKEDLQVLLKELFKSGVFATISFKGHIISVLKHFDPCSMYNFCFPRKEILEWFEHQNSVSMVVIPPNLGKDKSWKGLVICAAFFVPDYSEHQLLPSAMPYQVLCHLKTSGCCLNPVSMFSITKEKLKWLGHGFIWLTYIPSLLLAELNGKNYVAARIYSDCPGLMVNTCGIHLLYQKDIQELEETIIQCWTSIFDDLDSLNQLVVDENNGKLPESDNMESS